MSNLIIEVRSLVKRYGKVAALDGLTLSVPRGAVYGFLGRNGAGKTTTIRILAGLARPTEGSASVLGLNPQRERLAVLTRTGFVIEQVLLPAMTGNDLIRFNRAFFPTWSDAVAKRYAEALEIPLTCAFRKLSHGNRTKLCLLLALAQGVELLVLDEPTMGLDPVITDQFLRLLIEDFSGSGRTLLLSSHHLSEIEKICDWIGIIDRVGCCSKRSLTMFAPIMVAFAPLVSACHSKALLSLPCQRARVSANMSCGPASKTAQPNSGVRALLSWTPRR